ncbi:uncharacterized protein LOC119611015 [Lucilia sericata]|uniref:uncharacterized protein LOC119611015 n=1 Tax=Lucilia sericata TaxID=13632 RepID=UPI0018A8769A|nr:uncharacterized protein LOC119611015 [Lucilia sericata]
MDFNTDYGCPLCNRLHAIRQCSRFIVMPVELKLRVVAQNLLCYNCLAQSHSRANCRSIDRCRRCMQDHNTWLHPLPQGRIWFPMTALIRVVTNHDTDVFIRALIEPTAARSAIMKREVEELGLRISKGRTDIVVYHRREEKRRITVECILEDKIYGRSPIVNVERADKYPRPTTVDRANADVHWHISCPYQLILGADTMSRILIGPAMSRPGQLYAQNTIFGIAYFGEGVKRT